MRALRDIHSTPRGPAYFNLPGDREAEFVLADPAYWHGQPPPAPGPVVDHHSLQAFVNFGAWVARCGCGSAQILSRTDRRFFCIECGNVEAGGHWVRVIWPPNAAKIEAELVKRPQDRNRNWVPGESVADLRDELTLNKAITEGLTGFVLLKGRRP